MQSINKIMIYYWDKKLKKRLHIQEADIITIEKKTDSMSRVRRMYFLLDVFQMITTALLSVINRYHINGLHLFLGTLYFNVNWFSFATVWVTAYLLRFLLGILANLKSAVVWMCHTVMK